MKLSAIQKRIMLLKEANNIRFAKQMITNPNPEETNV
jgi:hypothetical protein